MVDRRTAEQFYNSAIAAVADTTNPKHLEIAYSLFSSACHADPTFALAWFQSGNNNSDLNWIHAAVAQWRRALTCENDDHQRAKILINLAWRCTTLGRSLEAKAHARHAIKLKPPPVDLAMAWLNLSLAERDICNSKASVSAAREAYRLDGQNAHNEIALAFALLFDGQYQEGFKHYERRFEWRLQQYLHFPYSKWNGEPGKTIYVAADQGLGDTLGFSRFLEQACKRSKYVHALVQAELLHLFMHSFAHIQNLNLLPMSSPFPEADHWTTFMSLPYALGLTDAEVRDQPTIDLPHFVLPNNWKVPDQKLHVGFAWAGSPLADNNIWRNVPVQQFYDLYRVPGVQLYSLQVGPQSDEFSKTGGAALIRDLAPYIRSVCDTLSLVRELDLVITVDSALGHIAGALGKETWVPYSYCGRDWRFGVAGEQPLLWYPKHKVFRQGSDLQWGPVFEHIVEALEEKVGA
jgi:tetratricopeptide (TPR) repeat protein